jgi:subtilisin family serine protease
MKRYRIPALGAAFLAAVLSILFLFAWRAGQTTTDAPASMAERADASGSGAREAGDDPAASGRSSDPARGDSDSDPGLPAPARASSPAVVAPEAVYAVNDPFGIVSPVAKLVANGVELDRRELAPDAEGRPGRLRLIRTEEFKHPYLRVEERFAPYAGLPDGPLNPFPDIVVSVANHVLVQFDAALSPAEIEARVAAMGGAIDEFTLSPGLVVVELPEATLDAMPEAAARYPDLAEVRFAEANYVVGHLGGVIPNDTHWNQLWGMRQIDMPEAWQITTGNREIVVAVIDSGVDYTHPDLKDNMDNRGYDFYANNSDPMDENRHGTHVAGTVAAVGNNNLGVVGVAWETRIMALRFLGKSGGGTIAGGINSIRYATQKGVDMTNNSWGGGGFSEALYEAIKEARDAGILFVAAAGNDGSSQPGYPARMGNPGLPGGFEPLDNIIIVAASSNNADDTLASFSQRNAHLAAPGVGIYSTVLGTSYQALSGTSMASPHVAGAAALLLAVEPDLTYGEVKDALLMYVDDRSADPLYNESIHSKGRLNVFNSLSNIDRPVMTHVETVFVDSAGLGSDPVRAGNGVINPGETVDLTLSLRSVGIEDAYNVSATLSSTSSNITIDPAHDTHTYGDFDRFQTEANTSPFIFTVDENTPTPYQIPLTLTINFTDGSGTPYESVRTFNLTVFTSVDVSGVVRHLDGSPFDGAQVVYTGPFAGSATTGSNGAFTFEMVDGTYRVFADAEGFSRSATREYTAPPGTTDLNFVLGNRIIESSVAAIEAEALPGGQVTVTLDLSNIGNLPLDWQLRETEYDFEHIIDAMDEDGNSLDPERPELGWKEIRTEYGGEGGRRHDWFELYRPAVNMSASGMLGFIGQEASSAAMMFDFDFPFYGQTFRSTRVQGAGWLSFNETSRSIFQHQQRRLPQLNYTPYMIAFQWSIRSVGGSGTDGWIHRKPHSNDWNPPEDEPFRDTRHGYSKNWDPYSWVFTWNQFGSMFVRTPTEFDTGQIELRSDGSIIMRYLKYELAAGVTEPTFEGGPVFFQVGMQDGSRTRGLSPMFMGYTAYEQNLAPWPGSVLIMRPAVAAGWIHPDQTRGRLSSLQGQTTLTLTLDATQLPEGVFESSIVVDSNDSSGSQALRIPITLTVSNAAAGVTITTPSEDGSANPGDNLTLTATVYGSADPAEVTFLNDGVEIGSAAISGSTATWTWEDIPAGFHELRARVISSVTGHTVYSPIRKIEAGQGLRVRLEFEDQPMQSLSVLDPISTLFQPPVISYNRVSAERFDIQPILFNEEDFTWLGSESTRDEWRRGEHVSVSSDGTQVRFVDRNYRKHPITYTITPNTVLEFDLLMHRYTDSEYYVGRAAIGLLNANSVDVSRMFSLDYPNRNFGILDFADYTARRGDSIDPVFVKYRIPVGQFYTGDVSYLGFVGAGPHASSGGDTDVVLRNVRIYESSTSGDFTYNWTFNDTDREVDTVESSRTYFSPGTKEIQVEVSDGFFSNTASRRMEIPGEDTFRVAIDFGVPHRKVPGNIKDTGDAFGDRGNDLRYGWDRNRTADRMSDNVWNFTGMKQTDDFIRAGNGATWRMEVPNGVYTVTAYVGRNYANTNNLIRFNGETLIDRNLTNGNFYENSLTLPVTDGEIVISSHRNTAAITHLHIVRVRSVNAMPVASFTVSPQVAIAGQAIHFDASDSFSSLGPIVHYAWDFGDGFTGEGMSTAYSYALPGTYEVTLSVTDSEGMVSQTAASVVVGGVNQPALIQSLPALPPALPPVFGEPQPQPGYELTEGGGSLSYGLRLATAPAAHVTVTISTGTRLTATPDTLTFTPANWNTIQVLSLTAVDDEIVNGSSAESVTTTATSADTAYNGLVGAPFNVTVHDNDAYGTLQFTQSAITVNEDAGTIELTVTRMGGQSGTLTANWSTVNGTATGGQDFVAASGTLVWAHNETGAKTIPITIIDDDEPEPTENFQVQISSATNQYSENVLGSPSAVTITILDNDNVNPAIILNTPVDGATFESGDVVTLSAEVLSNTANITSVRFLVDGSAVSTFTAPTSGDTYSFDWTVQTGTSQWQVEAHDDNGGYTLSEARSFTVTPIEFGSEGGFLREIFYGISGNNVSDLTNSPKFPNNPDVFTFVESGTLRYQENVNNYGTRHRAYFVPPKTGDYVFHLSVRNSAQVWLSPDASPHNRQLIVSSNNGTATRSLVAGELYYLEVLHKSGETTHDRFVQVGVRLPGNQNIGAIPVGLLRPFEGMRIETTTDLIRVPEGGHIFFGARLSHPPYDEVRIDVTAEDFIDGGDSITVGGGTPMIFNDSNWDVWQYVELLAAVDQDAIDGERTIRLTMNNGLFREITAQEIDAQLNHAPEVFITLPTVPSVNLVDTAAGLWLESDPWDPDGDELTLVWTKESGPGTVTFDDINAADTGARFSADGEYVLRVTVSDGEFEAYDEVRVRINFNPIQFGSVGAAGGGSFSVDGENWAVSGHGTGIGPGSESFRFVYTEIEGDFDIVARLTSFPTRANSRAALHVRGDLGLGSPFMSAGSWQDSGTGVLRHVLDTRVSQDGTYNWRAISNMAPSTWPGAPPNPGQGWIRFRRVGNEFTPFTMNSSGAWVTDPNHAATLQVGPTVLVGMLVCSGNSSTVVNSTWEHVTIPVNSSTAPQVNAGSDFTVNQNTPVQLSGLADDDGQPAGVLDVMWRRIAGPAAPGVSDPDDIYTLDPVVTFSVPGTYVLRLLATDGEAGTFDDVTVTVNATDPGPPIILEDPQPQMVPIGTSATFSVSAFAFPAATYQWYRVGDPDTVVNGATSATLTIDPVQTTDVGGYYVVVTNSEGSATSATASLGILHPPAAPSGLFATPLSPNQIQLTWTDNSDNEAGFEIAFADGTLIATRPSNTTSHTVGGLAPATPYAFRVRAFNAAGMSPWSAQASATTPQRSERQYLLNFGDTPYTSDGSRTWQSFRLRQTLGTDSPKLEHTNILLTDTEGDASEGIRFSATSTVSNNMGHQGSDVVLQSFFDGNPFAWFNPAVNAQREVPAFNQSGASWTYEFTGFAPADTVTFEMVIRRPGTGRNITVVFNPGGPGSATLLNNADSGVTRYLTHTATGAQTYRVVLSSNVANWVASINAMALTVESAAPAMNFANWIADPARNVPPHQRGPADNPSGDGLPNLVKFALNLDPLLPAPDQVPVLGEQVIGTERHLTLSYRQRAGGVGVPGMGYTVDGIVYHVEVSGTLEPGSWHTGADWFDVAGPAHNHGDGTETVTLRLKPPVGPDAPHFLRLRIDMAE